MEWLRRQQRPVSGPTEVVATKSGQGQNLPPVTGGWGSITPREAAFTERLLCFCGQRKDAHKVSVQVDS
jgi:hypothetical protein